MENLSSSEDPNNPNRVVRNGNMSPLIILSPGTVNINGSSDIQFGERRYPQLNGDGNLTRITEAILPLHSLISNVQNLLQQANLDQNGINTNLSLNGATVSGEARQKLPGGKHHLQTYKMPPQTIPELVVDLNNPACVMEGLHQLSNHLVKAAILTWNQLPNKEFFLKLCEKLQTSKYLGKIHIQINTDFALYNNIQQEVEYHCILIMEIFKLHSARLLIELHQHFSTEGSRVFLHVLEHLVHTVDLSTCSRLQYEITDGWCIYTCDVIPVVVDKKIPLGDWSRKYFNNSCSVANQRKLWR